jgi:2-polyprenyl-6-methoxyphenol hydroxylase-like FAD-dependent oxidoreductase
MECFGIGTKSISAPEQFFTCTRDHPEPELGAKSAMASSESFSGKEYTIASNDHTTDPVRRVLHFHSEASKGLKNREEGSSTKPSPAKTLQLSESCEQDALACASEVRIRTVRSSPESGSPGVAASTVLARDPAVVLGAGPAGCLIALELSRLGIPVEVFEYRPAHYFRPYIEYAGGGGDRAPYQRYRGRSINLALSARGLRALENVGLAQRIQQIGVPMRGRMIHDTAGRVHFQAYGGRPEEYLLSVSRTTLNQMLVETCLLDERGLITMHFGKKCTDIDLDQCVLTFEDGWMSPRHHGWPESNTEDTVDSPPSSRSLERERRARKRAAPARGFLGTKERTPRTPQHDATHREPGAEAVPGSLMSSTGRSTSAGAVSTRHVTASFIIGADGAHSRVRQAMQRLVPFNYEQEYIPTAYKELSIPSRIQRDDTGGSSGSYLLAPHALHIWPRHRFMLIALPNRDGSFTATLFMNRDADPGAPDVPSFATVRTPSQIQQFFESYFPDIYALVPSLVADYQSNPVAPLFTIRCAPFHYRGRAVLVGDAAHVMVPFYGQGCNAAMEDCRILANFFREEIRLAALRAPNRRVRGCVRLPASDLMVDFEDGIAEDDLTDAKGLQRALADDGYLGGVVDSESEGAALLDLERVFSAYSAERKPNADAITNLALENYWEMASKTSSRLFRWKREIQNQLHALMPCYFMSLYHMISFSNIPYAESVRRAQKQDRVMNALFRSLGLGCVSFAGFMLWRACHLLRKAQRN